MEAKQRRMLETIHTMFTTPQIETIFSADMEVQQMLRFEAALARAEAKAGVIPQAAADAIAANCRAELFNIAGVFREAVVAGTPAIPLVRMLTEQVGGDADTYVHWGATSQDVIDTAMMLQMRAGLDLLIAGLLDVCAHCAVLAEQHRRTPMAGRTLLQHALPITFGLKAARWLALATRQVQHLRAVRNHALALQFGGAVGTLAALGDKGMEVAELLAAELELPLPDLPWHAERDRIAQIAVALGIGAGAMAKIANDLVLLAQTEVGEAAEATAPGTLWVKGGSSAMPQKRNPVDAMEALAGARLATGIVPVILHAMTNEHERAVGGWQAEWVAIPDLFRYAAGVVERVRSAVHGVQIDPERMRANLDGGGLLMAEALMVALARHWGRPEAQRVVQAVCTRARTTNTTLRQAACEDAQIGNVLAPSAIDQALDPTNYLGSADVLIDRALAAYRDVQQHGTLP